MRVGLVILNKNEIEALPYVLDRIPKNIFESIVAIDGGSSDGSIELLRKSGYEVLSQASRGRGAGFSLGFMLAIQKELDYLCFLSTDGNEDPIDLNQMVAIIKSRSPDIVIASRMLKESWNEEDHHLFRPRKWGNKVFAFLAFILYGRGSRFISDPINGYRGISTKTWKSIAPDAEHFNIEFQISVRAYRQKLNVIEFPTKEGPRIGGASGAKAFPTTLAMIRVLLTERHRKQ